MTTSVIRPKPSRSVAVKQKLDFPVIDTDLHTIEYTPLLEDYIAKYGGTKLVDDFRQAIKRGISYLGHEWYTQYKFYQEANPSFFEGTAVEAKLKQGKAKPRPQPTAAEASPSPAE